jgi:glycosyltransferase involved in cell wall biosynthesis
MKKTLLFAINVDWYFNLHWRDRLQSEIVAGFDTYLCLSETKDNNNWGEFKFRKISLSRSSMGLWNNLKTFWGAFRIFREVNPTVVQSVTVKPNIVFGLLALAYSRPILITIPGLGYVFSNNGFKAWSLQRLLLFLYRIIAWNRKAAFIFENTSDLALFQKKGICNGANSIAVPGAGVDINRFTKRPMRWNESGELKLLFAARLVKGKGLYELVEVVSELRREGFPVSLSVAGLIDTDSPDSIPLRQIEQWHRQGKIQWMGEIHDMETVIAANHVVVLPTRYGEGLPRILLEANACGRPVITTNIPGCNSFVMNEKNGIIVETSDCQALKHAIKRLRNKTLCLELGENGRKHVEASYTERHVIDCYKEIYQTRLGGGELICE